MSDGSKMLIEILTSWILKAFLGFVPKWTGGRMETAWMSALFRPGYSLPLNKFSPTSENFFSFSSLTTDYCILPTAYLGAVPKNAYLCSSLKSFSSSLVSFCPRFEAVIREGKKKNFQ